MARLAYSAPGVYVEEIPSGRQPIAGVGTNTAGFIGIVPNEIYVPVPNPDYDPVLARAMAELQFSKASESTDVSRNRLTDELARLKSDLAARSGDNKTKLETAQSTANADVERLATEVAAAEVAFNAANTADPRVRSAVDDARRQRDSKQADLSKAREELKTATEGLNAANADLARLPAEIERIESVLGAKPEEKPADTDDENLGITIKDNDPRLMPSIFSPYYLKSVPVEADEFATKLCTNFSEYTARFGDFSAFKPLPQNPDDPPSQWLFNPIHLGHHLLTHAVDGFFKNGGTKCFVARVKPDNVSNWTRALDRFKSIEDVSILAAPGLPKNGDTWGELETYCEEDTHQNVFAILDSPLVVGNGEVDIEALKPGGDAMPRKSSHAAYYFPAIEVMDPSKRLQDSDPARCVVPKYRGLTYVAPSGHVAGIYARTDEERGVFKAPANATVRGALEVKYYVSKPMQELLNPQGVNCIRLMNGDVTVWGARNVGGDSLGEWKYINVRRFAGFLEESISRGTQWIVFEPNDPNLWSRIILNVTAFLTNVWRSGALFGLTPQEAFYVKCDEELNPPEVRDLGQVITEIGVAIVRPAEFVIFRITQSTGPRQG